jgi:hypothetical protein
MGPLPRPVASGLILALAAVAAPRPATASDPDAAVRKRLGEVRARALKVRVDGRTGDWAGIPSFEDADPLPVADRSLDIVRTSVAPLPDAFLVLVETAAPPSRASGAFSVDIEYRGFGARDAVVRVEADGAATATVFRERGTSAPLGALAVEAARRDALEIRVPRAILDAALEDPAAPAPPRSFVRVQVSSFAPPAPSPARRGTGTTAPAPAAVAADEGPAVACFLLSDPAPELDPPVAAAARPRRAVPPPVEGRWLVRQGGFGLWSHAESWAYDLTVTDHALRPTAVAGSRRLEDYYAFGRRVVAPEACSVVFESASMKDSEPLSRGTARNSGNTVILRLADGMRLFLGHLREGSLASRRGEEVAAGGPVAEVGNSGDSGAPHLHLSLHERPGEFVGLPLALRGVRVGLNPGDDDPWRRDLDEWTLREGFFFEKR